MLHHFHWRDLDESEARSLGANALFGGDATPLEDVEVEGRYAELPFYDDHRFVWIKLLPPDHDQLEHLFLLDHDTGGWSLDGNSMIIRTVNMKEGLDLDDEHVVDYLRFFCFAVQGEEGAFQLFETAPEAEHGERSEREARIAAMATPVRAKGEDDGKLLFEALVRYGSRLHRSDFSVTRDGAVLMEGDLELETDVPPGAFHDVPVIKPVQTLAATIWQAVSEAVPGTGTRRIMVEVLLERALGGRPGSRLLAQFNAKRPTNTPVENFAHLVATASPVVAIESSIPFVEETVADILGERLGSDEMPRLFTATPHDHDEAKLRLVVPPHGPAVGLLPLHGYTGVVDVERVAYQISARNLSCLIGCHRVDDLPDSLEEVVDVVVRLPRLDERTFETLFQRTLGMPPPPEWAESDTHWITHVHHSDFQQPAGLGLTPDKAIDFIRERAGARLRDLEPVSGLGLSDLHGLGEARTFAEDLIGDIHEAIDGRLDWMHVDRGVLLVGAPGTGKTTLARAIAKDCGIRFVSSSAADWQAAGHLGDHLRAMRADFSQARRFAPAILFLDEIDSIGSRETFSGANAQYHVEVVNGLLQQIQGMDPEAPVIVIAATNFEERVDPALKRAGRLDRVIRIPRPNGRALAQIYDHYLEEYLGKEGAARIDTDDLGRLSLGATGADVEFFVRGAMRRAREERPVEPRHLIDELTRKPRDPDAVRRLTPREMHRVAVHEAGHALAACLSRSKGEDLAFISIVPRSDGSLGFIAKLPSERAFLTRAEYLEKLEVFLAGRAAEQIVFGTDHVSSGAGGSSRSSDLAVATRTAIEVVTQYGLGPDGGLLWSEAPDDDDRAEAEQLLSEAYERIWRKLDENGESLKAIMKALMDRQELTGEEVRGLVG